MRGSFVPVRGKLCKRTFGTGLLARATTEQARAYTCSVHYHVQANPNHELDVVTHNRTQHVL
jgi:hypothetical protein